MTGLRTVLDALPDGALVPVGWVRSQLDALPAADTPANDLTAAAFAQLVGCSAATVRSWCERGLIPGCYKLPASSERRASWRIPAASVELFRQQQAKSPAPLTGAARACPARPGADEPRHVRQGPR